MDEITQRPAWTKEEATHLCGLREIGHTYPEIENLMAADGFPTRSAQAYKDAIRRNSMVRKMYFTDSEDNLPVSNTMKMDIEYGELGPTTSVQTNRPRSAEEMSELFDINMDIYYPHKIITNQWAKNWQTKVDWRLNEANALVHGLLFEDLCDKFSRHSWPVLLQARETGNSQYLDVIEIVDAHHGCKSWAPETGTNWDLKISLKEHETAFHHFLERRRGASCIIRVGDDLFHFDTLIQQKGGATQKGTVQDIDSRWQKMFIDVTEMMINLITSATRAYEHVTIALIQGNHDYQTSYYLGQLLKHRFHEAKNIHFDIQPRSRKYFRFGSTLIGMAHSFGKMGIKSLADKIREEARKDWGHTDYVEFHIGDKHHEFTEDRSGTGVVTRIVRALCPNDSWHDEEGYSSHRGAQMFTYHLTEGLDNITYYRTRAQSPYRPDVAIGATII